MPWLGDVRECPACGDAHQGIEIRPVDVSLIRNDPELQQAMRESFRADRVSEFTCPHFQAIAMTRAASVRRDPEELFRAQS